MRIQHGRLAVDVPSGWADRSTMLFVGPPPTALPTTASTRVAQPSLTVTFARAPAGEPRAAARQVLDDELTGLRAMGLAIEPVGTGDFDCAFGPGAASEHRVTLDGVTLHQIHAVAVRDGICVRAVAACGALDFAALAPTLRGALASLTLGPPEAT